MVDLIVVEDASAAQENIGNVVLQYALGLLSVHPRCLMRGAKTLACMLNKIRVDDPSNTDTTCKQLFFAHPLDTYLKTSFRLSSLIVLVKNHF